jgi:uncharacterized membrane protein
MTVRFAFGLVASACALPIVGASAFSNLHDSFWIAVLALVTGLLGLGLYYYGLQRTPAPLAALGELAFPVTATLVGIYVFHDTLRWTQWVGIAITVQIGDDHSARSVFLLVIPDFGETVSDHGKDTRRRRRSAGLCARCGKVASTKYLCDGCNDQATAYQRRLRGFRPWRPGGLGRPPKRATTQPKGT